MFYVTAYIIYNTSYMKNNILTYLPQYSDLLILKHTYLKLYFFLTLETIIIYIDEGI